MIPTNKSFGTIWFIFPIFSEIVIEIKKSMFIDSHFKTLIINHGPEGILISLLIINNLAWIFVIFQECNFIFINNIDSFVLFKVNNKSVNFIFIKFRNLSQITWFFIIGHIMSTVIIQNSIKLFEFGNFEFPFSIYLTI